MALEKVKVIDGWLRATQEGGYAISEVYAADSVVETRSNFIDISLANIVTDLITPEADKVHLEASVVDGDTVILVLDDGSIHTHIVDIAETHVVEGNAVPAMTSNTTPSGVVTGSADAYEIFDRSTLTAMGSAAPVTITYEFDIAQVITAVNVYHSAGDFELFRVEGSNDGVEWVTLINDGSFFLTQLSTLSRVELDFANIDAYKFIKTTFGVDVTMRMVELIKSPTVYTLDVTAITQGAVCSRVYIEKEAMYQNDIKLTPTGNYYHLGNNETLSCRKDFADLILPASTNEIITKVDIFSSGTEVRRISSKLYK